MLSVYGNDGSDINEVKEEHIHCYELNWDFILSILRLKEYVYPLTAKKLQYWIFYLLVIAFILSLEFTVGFSEYIIFALAETSLLPLMVILYGIEPIFFCMSMIFTQYPKPNFSLDVTGHSLETIRRHHQSVAIIIPTHNSENEIGATIASCLKVVSPHQIFVIDNGNYSQPTDKTKEVIKKISNDIVYYWHPYGNKTVAQYIGARYLAENYDYCICLDDDMFFPENFFLDSALFTDHHEAIIYPIRAVSGGRGSNILLRWQDIEYQLSDHYKMFEDKFHGVLFPHGAIAAWRRKSLCRVLMQHNTRFIAEDIQSGLICEYLKIKKHIDMRFHFRTIAPYSVLGKPLNLYQQRVRGWSIGAHPLCQDSCRLS